MANRGVNKVILIGNIGHEPEIRYMPNGGPVANITIATSEGWRDKQTGEMREKTEWHRVVLFGKLAEIASEYLHKGSQIYIEGSLQTRRWQDQNGQDRYTTEIIVNVNGTMQMLGSNRQVTTNVSSVNNNINSEVSNKSLNKTPQNKNGKRENEIENVHSTMQSSIATMTNDDTLIDFNDDIPF